MQFVADAVVHLGVLARHRQLRFVLGVLELLGCSTTYSLRAVFLDFAALFIYQV